MPDQPTQPQLDAEALARTLRIGRQMMAFADEIGGKANPERLQKRCPDCFGTGREQSDEPNLIAPCRSCGGEGMVP